ncbi:hypothetical protein ScPMuIL_002595 [Solemya velum]
MLVGLLPSIGMAKNECGDVKSRLYIMLHCHEKPDKHLLCSLFKNCGTKTHCSDILDDDESAQSGIYSVVVDGAEHDVYCEMDLYGGGWTVFQKRFDGSVDFNRNWTEYEDGFGNLNGEFWLGDQFVPIETSNDLLIRMVQFDGTVHYIEYMDFKVQNASVNYRLHIGPVISGNATDDLKKHDRMEFTTYDADNTPYSMDCGGDFSSGWWFQSCVYANLNGLYLSAVHTSSFQGIIWYGITGKRASLQATDMMYRPPLEG